MSTISSLTGCTTCLRIPPAHYALSWCTQCHLASYCSKECQKRDWPIHKKNCSPLADISVFNPVKCFTDRHQHNFRVVTQHLLTNRYGASQVISSLNYGGFVVLFEIRQREGNVRHIAPACRFILSDISLVPISEWDTSFATCSNLVGRAAEVQVSRQEEADRQQQNIRAQHGAYIGTTIVAVKVVDFSAVLIVYDSLYIECIQRLSCPLSTPFIPIPTNTWWREALFTMVERGHYPWPRAETVGGWQCVEDTWNSVEKKWAKKPLGMQEQIQNSYLPGTVGVMLLLISSQIRDGMLQMTAEDPSLLDEDFLLSCFSDGSM